MKSLYEFNPRLIIGMEMFETDDQIIIEEYLRGWIEERQLLNEAKIWDNYKTDYKALVDFAREKKLQLIASNIPRRYANMAYRKGINALDSLPETAKKYIAPLPIEIDLGLKGYNTMIIEMGAHGGGNAENLAKSQALKDATMAYFISQQVRPGNIVLHINGAYHSQEGEGIIWYVKKSKPDIRISTIHVVEQADIEKLESSNLGKADFHYLCAGRYDEDALIVNR